MDKQKSTRVLTSTQAPSILTPEQREADQQARKRLCDVSCALSTLATSLDVMATNSPDSWEAGDRTIYLSGLSTMLRMLTVEISDLDDDLIEPEPLPGSPEAIAAAAFQPQTAEAA